MKKIIIILLMALSLGMGFTMIGAGKKSTSGLMPDITVEKAFASEIAADSMAPGNHGDQDASAFSWKTILYMYTLIIVSVSVRRKTNE